ncbi:MAG: hypothetical protein F6J87_18410 [Spirulina sp. SIO3F2]|nr:hypothetical protein [Spirulina sp. SIO3F2]
MIRSLLPLSRQHLLPAIALAVSTAILAPSAAIAQQVVNATPTGQDVPENSSIAWQFDDVSLVNAQSIKIFLNDQEVTGQSILDPGRNYFGYRPSQELTPGSHNVRVEFATPQGVGYAATWSFAVPNTAIEISSVTHNGAEQPLGKDATFLATVNGTPGAQASVLLVQNGQTVRTVPASEVSSGVYVATVTVGAQDAVKEGILVGRLAQGDRVVYSVAPQAFAFNPSTTATTVTQTQTTQTTGTTNTSGSTSTAQALTLTVTDPANNTVINSKSGFTITGTTTPGAVVTVDAVAPPVRVGPFSVGSAQTLLDGAQATVAADGTFSVAVPRPAVLQGGMKYNVTVTAEKDGTQEQVTLTLTQA